MGNMPELFEDRERLNKLIGDKIKERNALRDEFRQQEREFNAYLAEIRKVRQERAQEQRLERQKEYEVVRKQREVEKLEDNPYVSEIALIEQTMLWCKNMLPKEGDAKVEKKSTADGAAAAKDGEQVLVSKDQRE